MRNRMMLVMFMVVSYAAAVQVSDDLWDVSQGAVIIENSPILGGSSVSNMFGANDGSVEWPYGRTLFWDGYYAGADHYVEWRTPTAVALESFKLYAAHDGTSECWRAFDYFTLLAKNADTGMFEIIYASAVSVPYNFIDGEQDFLIQHTFAAPVAAQEFKAVFRQYAYNPYAAGPRVIELDGFGYVPEPMTLALLGFGSLVLLKRNR